jgi:hypothetical protein
MHLHTVHPPVSADDAVATRSGDYRRARALHARDLDVRIDTVEALRRWDEAAVAAAAAGAGGV